MNILKKDMLQVWRGFKLFCLLGLGFSLILLGAVIFVSVCMVLGVFLHHFLGTVGMLVFVGLSMLISIFYKLGE